MTIRFAVILGVLLVAATGSIGAVWTLAPNDGVGDTATAGAGTPQLAAASAAFLACKDKCYTDNNCEARYGIAVTGIPNPQLTACTDKRRACVKACPK